MILSDHDIKIALKNKDISITPYNNKYLQPASVDLHLDKHFLIFDSTTQVAIDPKLPLDDMMKKVTINEKRPFILHPGEFALGMIYEITGVSDQYVGRLEGKSSIGRLGLLIHVTAGFLDPGNELKMTLELHNTANLPIKLYYKMPIAQMAFEKISSKVEHPYSVALGSHYVGDMAPRASQIWKSFKKSR